MRRTTYTRIAFLVLLFVILSFLYGPMLHPIMTSMTRPLADGSGVVVTFEPYLTMFDDRMIAPALGNSLIAAMLTGVITPILALLAALSVRQFAFKRSIIFLMLIPLFIPGVTMGLASALLLKVLGIPSTLATIVLVHVVWAMPFAFLIILTVMADFKAVYLEAANMSGANDWQAFVDVELPLIRPGLVGAGIFSAIISFNETIRTTMVQGANNTIQTYIWSQFQQVGLSPGLVALMASLILVTMAVIGATLLLFSRSKKAKPAHVE